jgi:cell filamentation protein, protein adenylyltransferase
MNKKAFQNPAGRIVRALKGYDYFLPAPLPPKLAITDLGFISLIARASQAVGKLAGLGYTIPNPSFLVIPYTRLEAVASSRIEGTQASLSELFYFEAAQQKPKISHDLLEVQNYLNALFYGLERVQTLPMSLRLLKEIHERLMNDVRGGTANMTPGEFRRSQNWIGSVGCTLNNASYVPPHHSELLGVLGNWEKYLHDPSDLLLVQCAIMHYQFEAIHPFLDGNGRVGRLFISLFLVEKGILPQPLLYLSAFFERHRDEYYSLLLRVSQKGDWESWIKFFLQAVITQSEHATESARRIIDERERYRLILQQEKKTRAYTGLVDLIFINPYFNIQQAAEALDSTYHTARKAVRIVEEMGIVEEITGKARNRIYVARQLLELLVDNEPIYMPKGTQKSKKNDSP